MRGVLGLGGARIVAGMLGYAMAMAALATLSPFDFQIVPGRGFAVLWLTDDVLLNLVLLFPVGFLFSLADRSSTLRAVRALLLGLGLSLALELSQLFLPSRHSNAVDVVANAAGCWLGALAERQIGRWLGGFLSEDLVLELPLTGALYLLVPLLMLHALGASGGDDGHVWLALPLAFFGATIVAALYQQRVARSHALSPLRFAIYAALAFVAALLPAFSQHPLEVAGAALCMTLAIWGLVRFEIGVSSAQRRFEASTVRRALPWFALYLLGLIATASGGGSSAELGESAGHREALRLLESIAALTVSGYLMSEVVSRTAWSSRALVVAIALVGVGLGFVLELSHDDHAARLSRLLRILAHGCSAGAGASLHRAQVGLVKRLRALVPAHATQRSADVAPSLPPQA
jgi:hypothetical protein